MSKYPDLVQRLRGVNWVCHTYGKTEVLHDTVCHEAADVIEHLQRELNCSKEMWEQQQELALEYLADIEKANEWIAELERQEADALREATILAESLSRHWPDNTSWRPLDEAAGVITQISNMCAGLNERIAELEAAMREIYEVYAGSEGFIPETCAEGYQQQLIKEMSDIAAKHMRKGLGEI